MCNGRGKQIIFGMAEEFLRESIKYGYDSLPDEWAKGELEYLGYEMSDVVEKYKNGEISKEEYDRWRYTYPEVEVQRTRDALDSLRNKGE